MAMTNSDKLHVEPTPVGWTAYYDPEGLHGDGASRADALEDLLEQTDEAWRKALDEKDALRRSISDSVKEADANAPWMTEAHMLCSDHGIPHGLLTERIRALRRQLEDEGIQSEAALAAQAARENDLMKYAGELEASLRLIRKHKNALFNVAAVGDDKPTIRDLVDDALAKGAALSKNTAEAE
jgi:hypothetical protein